jgi:carbonic anhydrase
MDDHMRGLVAGITATWAAKRPGREDFWAGLAEGQKPGVCVICCSDSRAAPEQIMQPDPGTLFVLRSVAGLVPAPPGRIEGAWMRLYGSVTRRLGMRDLAGAWYGPWAAIEYAALHLEVPNLLLLGHSGCGGIGLAGRPHGDERGLPDTDAWVDMVRPTVKAAHRKAERSGRDPKRVAEEAAILWSLRNLLLHPRVNARVTARTLRLYAGHFDIASGHISLFNPESGAFETMGAHMPGICEHETQATCNCRVKVKAALTAFGIEVPKASVASPRG